MEYETISNKKITVDMMTGLQSINCLRFISCNFYNAFHHIYNLTNLTSLELNNCVFMKIDEINNSIHMYEREEVTDSIAKLINLKVFIISAETGINVSKKIFEMNLTCLILGTNVTVPNDVIYYNLMNYSSLYIDDKNINKKSNNALNHDDTQLNIICTSDNICISKHIKKLNIIFMTPYIYDNNIQNMFDNLPNELIELKITNCHHEGKLRNLPPSMNKLCFLWTMQSKGQVGNKIKYKYDQIISNLKIPFGTELINMHQKKFEE